MDIWSSSETAVRLEFSNMVNGERFGTWRELLDNLDRGDQAARVEVLRTRFGAGASARAAGAGADTDEDEDEDEGGMFPEQELGACRNLAQILDNARRKKDSRQRVSLSTKLIGRLGMLLYNGPEGTGQARKAFEQNVVEWVLDAHVPKCPDCGVAFSFMTRRSHCRLCGGVICQGCTKELPAGTAQDMHAIGDLTMSAVPKVVTCGPKVKTCSNCLKLCDSQMKQAVAVKAVRDERQTVHDRTQASSAMYKVLTRDLAQIESEAREYYDLASRLRRKQGLGLYAEAGAVKEGVLARVAQVQQVAGKLFSSETGHNHSCRLQVRLSIQNSNTLRVGRALVPLVPLPPAADIEALRRQQEATQQYVAEAVNFDSKTAFEIWQHERRHGCGSFGPDSLTEDDPPPWGSARGDWGYASVGIIKAKRGFAWSGEWQRDVRSGDEDGWTYAAEFKEGAAWTPHHDFRQHAVRRVRWIREQVVSERERSSSTSVPQRHMAAPASLGGAERSEPLPVPQRLQTASHTDRYAGSPRGSPRVEALAAAAGRGDADRPRSGSGGRHGSTGAKAWRASGCTLCEKKFTQMRRRHNCKHCGRAVCSKCSKARLRHVDYHGAVRACDRCAKT